MTGRRPPMLEAVLIVAGALVLMGLLMATLAGTGPAQWLPGGVGP